MPKPKVLSGLDVTRILASFGFGIESQRGSHIKLRRITAEGTRQTRTIPNHRELDRGTLIGIYRQALRYIPVEELAQHFYNE
jgi:predicted RNA binding protein YcfA (HicA-like mRNA interferase family)